MLTPLEQLGRAIKAAQARHHRALDTGLRSIGSTLTQWDALRAIANLPGASAHDLALATFQSDQSFGTLASRLEGQGLIERRPGRGRRIEHNLTEPGEAILRAGHDIAAELLAASFAELSDPERTHLLRLLSKVGARIGEPDPLTAG
jgi:DNA-binding MarR family transcriptional regulator